MTIQADQAPSILGGTLHDNDGDKVGKIGQVFLDDQTGRPAWVTVSTGLFGKKETFVPIDSATLEGNDVRVSYSKDTIKDAPNMDVDEGHLSESQEAELYRYYGLGSGTSYDTTGGGTTTGMGGTTGTYDDTTSTRDTMSTTDTYATGTTGTTDVTGVRDSGTSMSGSRGGGHDTSGPNTDDAMTRSEEQLRVGTEKVQTGRARLRKYVTTEQVSMTVPVTKEHVTLDREPITDANRGDAMSGGDITEEEHEIVLTEERPVVTTETVPVERVRMGTETEQTQETVSGQVRKEQIELDDPEKTTNR